MRLFTLIGITLVSLILLSCGMKALPAEKYPSSVKPAAPEAQSQVKKPWEVEWERMLGEARKEGKLILYCTKSPGDMQIIADGFKKATGLTVEKVAGRGGEIATKLLAERRASLYLADAYVGGTTTLLTQLKPGGALSPVMPYLFMPEVLDTQLWYKDVLPFMDKEKMILQTKYTPGGDILDIVFNTGLINKEELLSWHDLLKPKLKGKMVLHDPTTAGKGGKFINKAINVFGLDWDYMRALAKQQPFITRDERLMIEWVARGKYLLGINPRSEIYEQFKAAGSPLDDTLFKESRDILGGGNDNLALINRPPHPNAAKLFANWYLGKEGQTLMMRAYGYQSAREDISTDYLPPHRIRRPNVEYLVETEEFVLQEAKMRPIIEEIFGPLIK